MKMKKLLLLVVTCLLHGLAVGNVSITTTGQAGHTWFRSTGIRVVGPYHLVFEAKASRDALIHLSTSDSDDSQRWQVEIGGENNTRDYVGSVGREISGTYCPGRQSLDPNAYRTFWISWDQTHIRLGTGDVVGENEYCSYQGPSSLTDLYVRLGSWGDLNTVDWIIHEYTEKGRNIGLSLGLGIGGGVVVVLLIVFVALYTWRRKGRSNRNEEENTYTNLVYEKDIKKEDKPQSKTSTLEKSNDQQSSVYGDVEDPSLYMEPVY